MWQSNLNEFDSIPSSGSRILWMELIQFHPSEVCVNVVVIVMQSVVLALHISEIVSNFTSTTLDYMRDSTILWRHFVKPIVDAKFCKKIFYKNKYQKIYFLTEFKNFDTKKNINFF